MKDNQRRAMFANMKANARFRTYSFDNLNKRKTITEGQTDDLKIDTGNTRIWTARTTMADGEPYNKRVSVEKYNEKTGRWEIVDEYSG